MMAPEDQSEIRIARKTVAPSASRIGRKFYIQVVIFVGLPGSGNKRFSSWQECDAIEYAGLPVGYIPL
jgi:hypothetical protein